MADEKLIFPIGFDLEEGVRQVQKDWKKYQPEIQKTIDRNPLKVKLDISTKGLSLTNLKEYIKASKEVAKANREIAKTRSANALAAQRESRQRVQEATELDQIKQKKAQAALTEERLTQAKQRSANATQAQNTAYKTQSSYLSRLVQRMIAYASVAQAFSFIRNIRDVTAEFELQRVALGAIIGDLNEANAMFEQIKAAAVKSPFQIKELVTYTKQLAAYKIETDELFETTQKLADVSAGLGVGMERLVLAYGQIRATGYLRASEVRQLNEAGIPIVEELAKKMSDLRGETVSAAEVMSLISERAISFGMVKEVFDDMTSAGGMFYKMQEKQAETLAGQWSNLQDSIAIMYEEIGNSEGVQNTIKSMIGLVKSLAENWEIVGGVLVSIGGSYVGLRAGARIMDLLTVSSRKYHLSTLQLQRSIKDLRMAQKSGGEFAMMLARMQVGAARAQRQAAKATNLHTKAWYKLKAAVLSNPIGAILTVITTIISAVVTLTSEIGKLDKELASIGEESQLQSEQSVRNFERLAEMIRDSAKGTKEQKEALAELKRTYGDFLPQQDDAIINLVREKEAYEDVTQAIKDKIALQSKEQKIDRATSYYSEEMSGVTEELRKHLKEQGLSREEIASEFAKWDKLVQENVKNNIRTISEESAEIASVVNAISWFPDAFLPDNVEAFTDSGLSLWAEYIHLLEEYYSTLADIDAEYEASINHLGEYKKEYEELKKSIGDYSSVNKIGTFAYDEGALRHLKNLYERTIYNLWDTALEDKFIDEKLYNSYEGQFDAILDLLEEKVPAMRGIVRQLRQEYKDLLPSTEADAIKSSIISVAYATGLSLDKAKRYLMTNEQNINSWKEQLKKDMDEASESVLNYRSAVQYASKQGLPQKSDLESKLNDAIKIEKFLKELDDIWNFTNTKDEKTNPRIALLNEELSTVEKIYKEYQELRKFMSDEEARAKIADMFEGVNLTMLSQALSPTEMRAQLQKELDEAKKMGDKKQILELEYKLGKFDADDEQRKLEKSLKDLSDKISRTKTAKEFFDRMLGLTGNKQLSATLTMSVYGEGEEDLGTKLAQQTAKAFQDKYKGIDFSTEAISDKGVFNWNQILSEGESQKSKFGEDEYDKFLKDVDEGRKASAKRLDTLMNELQKTKTYSEKLVDIYTNTQERLNTIDQEVEDDAVRQRLKEQVNALQTKEMQKLQYESFKDSPMYVAMFENLDATSTAMLTNMRNHLIKLKSEWKNLDPTQLKELQSRINEIDKQLSTRNPFKGIVDGIKEFNTLRQKGTRKDDEQRLIEATGKRLQAQKDYEQAIAEGKGEEEIKRLASELDKCVEAEDKAAKKMSEWDDATREFMQSMQNLEQVTQLLQTTTTAVNDIVEAFGGWGDAVDEEFWNTMLDGMNKFVDGVASASFGIAKIVAGDIIGGTTSLISGIGSIVSSIGNFIYLSKIHDADKEIGQLQDRLDSLSYAYDRLQSAQEKAFGSDYISNYEQRLANLQAQQEAYLAQADAERSKGKKADEEKIKEYEEQARDAADAIKDMYGSLSEKFLGTDLTSAARDFANAWIDAYKEFSNTTDAMKAKFQDMIQNMIVESLLAKVMEKALEPVFTKIDEMQGGDFYSTSFWRDVMSTMQTATENGVVGAENVMSMLEQMGINLRGLGGEMTGISRDIATASEESILGLAAGINTQNFYISQVPPKLDTIIALLQSGGVQVGGGVNMQDLITIQNQHLSHLPNIAQNTAETVARCERAANACERMADQLDRVIKPRGTQATHTVNTSL